ncbi:hypothetical protein [Pelobium manganitolerans]|uniref:hypothetical protein n=1 Tax=Pelobium manganitolerans TaxID=1842495 RepID=UPI003FA35DF5
MENNYNENELQKLEKRKNTNKRIYRWFGVIIFIGLMFNAIGQGSSLSAVLFLIGALFCAPLTYRLLFNGINGKLNSTLKVLIVGVLFFVGVAFSNSKPANKAEATVTAVDTSTSVVEEKETVKEFTSWTYSDDVDEMTDKKTFYASTTSTNIIEFDFPYNGGSSFTLVIRKNSGGTDVYIKVSKGQFLGDYSGNRYLKLRFDDGKAVNYSYSMASDGSSDIVFVNNVHQLISKLKNAKKLKVSAEFYQEGNRIMEFDVSNLQWKH